MRDEATVLPNMLLNFRYLTQLKLIRMTAEPFGKQLCTILLTGNEIIFFIIFGSTQYRVVKPVFENPNIGLQKI